MKNLTSDGVKANLHEPKIPQNKIHVGVNIRVALPQNKPRDAGDEEHHIQHNCFHIQLLFDIVIEKDDKRQEAQQREHVAAITSVEKWKYILSVSHTEAFSEGQILGSK